MIKLFTSVLIACFVILVVPFTVMWYDHSGTVQTWVLESSIKYDQEMDWDGIRQKTPDEILETVRPALYKIHMVFSGGFDTKTRTEYQESIYDLIYAAMNNPDQIDSKIDGVEQAYSTWMKRIDKFTTNRLFAMRHTF
jgi:hypothetical protein